MKCHPERRLARILRQSQSKDLRLGTSTYAMNFRDSTLEHDAGRFVDSLDGTQVGKAVLAGRIGRQIAQDAVGEMVHLPYELHGVLLLACDINLDPGCSEFRPGGVVAGEVLALVGEGGHLEPSPGAVRAPVAAELDAVA